MKNKKQKENYLEIAFEKKAGLQYQENEAGEVTIFLENKGFFNRIMQKLFGKPKITQIHLEEFGNFIWKQIDGHQSVLEISEKVHNHFGEKAEPLLPRLVQYFQMLQNNGFIEKPLKTEK